MSPASWSIVLAGGRGQRLKDLAQRRFGEARPKPYCAFAGGRSMIEHALQRAASLSGQAHTITVVSADHERWWRPTLAGHVGLHVVQTRNRETAPGVFLPLAHVRARAPDAVVYVLPSDHEIRPLERFVAAMRAAGELAAACPDRIVLTGVAPTEADCDYGYIEPGEAWGGAGIVRRVRGFVEKPCVEVARAAIATGSLWSTMIVASTVRALWDAGRAALPDMIAGFDRVVDAIGAPHECAVTEEVYRDLPIASFSRDVLVRATDRCLLWPLTGIEWSDWGVPARLEAALGAESAARELVPARRVGQRRG